VKPAPDTVSVRVTLPHWWLQLWRPVVVRAVRPHALTVRTSGPDGVLVTLERQELEPLTEAVRRELHQSLHPRHHGALDHLRIEEVAPLTRQPEGP
jgi:hypothetical protein